MIPTLLILFCLRFEVIPVELPSGISASNIVVITVYVYHPATNAPPAKVTNSIPTRRFNGALTGTVEITQENIRKYNLPPWPLPPMRPSTNTMESATIKADAMLEYFRRGGQKGRN